MFHEFVKFSSFELCYNIKRTVLLSVEYVYDVNKYKLIYKIKALI